jgi:hypothetical protein
MAFAPHMGSQALRTATCRAACWYVLREETAAALAMAALLLIAVWL